MKCSTCGRGYQNPEDYLRNTSRWRVASDKSLWFNCKCDSTLMLAPGHYDWYKPELSMSTEAASVFNLLANKNDIPYMSAHLMELQSLLGNPDSAPTKLAEVLKNEPHIAAEILELANNRKKSAGSKIRSIEHAVVFIGRGSVTDMVRVAAAKQLKFKTKSYTPASHWTHSLLTGMLAEELATRYGKTAEVQPDEAYLGGALCNIGRIVAAFCLPAETEAYWTAIKIPANNLTREAAESQFGIPDHRILGEIAVGLWGMPPFIADVARRHHDIPAEKAKVLDLYSIVALANQLTHAILHEERFVESDLVTRLRAIAEIDDTKWQDLIEFGKSMAIRAKSMAMMMRR